MGDYKRSQDVSAPAGHGQSLTPVQLYVVSSGERAIKFVRRHDAGAPGA